MTASFTMRRETFIQPPACSGFLSETVFLKQTPGCLMQRLQVLQSRQLEKAGQELLWRPQGQNASLRASC
jgi:hypothetical protein